VELYRLPRFVAETLSIQPSPPRQVPVSSVIRAVMGGIDCQIYAAGGLFFIVFGLVGLTAGPIAFWIGVGFLVAGALSLWLAIFRIRQVSRALQLGDAQIVEITDAEAGRARWYGTPWGDLMRGTAARGRYQLAGTGENGIYYMQQAWALSLRPGDQIWVVHASGRDVLYAPVARQPNEPALASTPGN
jgi:hypothetical protein